MDKEYWHQRWHSREIGFNQLQPNQFLQRYFPLLKLKPGCRVFVPLCGQSIDMLWLAGQGYQVIGVELSETACNAFFKENKIPFKITERNDFIVYSSDEITIFLGDFFNLNPTILDKIDAVYDRAALVTLPAETRKSYAEHLITLMDPVAAMLLITITYSQKEMQGPPFSVDNDEVTALYSAYFDINRLHNEHFFEVPAHLQEKGLRQATESVYSLIKI